MYIYTGWIRKTKHVTKSAKNGSNVKILWYVKQRRSEILLKEGEFSAKETYRLRNKKGNVRPLAEIPEKQETSGKESM